MAVDIYSARLGMLEMGTGNQNNSWGTSFNGSVTDVIDRAIAGIITRANTGGTLDLSTNPPPAAMRQDIDAIQNFTGALTAHQTVIVPNLSKTWLFRNNTSGAFQLYVKTTAGTATMIPQGATKMVFCDGNDVVKRLDDEEIGSFRISGKPNIGAGEIQCSGQSLLRSEYPDLYNKIGTTWGAADGTHFTLPNFTDTGRFLRSAAGGLAVGTYQSNQNLAHTHTASTSAVTGTTDNPGNHTHANTLNDPGHSHTYDPRNAGALQAGGTNGGITNPQQTSTNTTGISLTNAAAGAHTHTVTGTAAAQTLTSNGGTEARPESAVVLICIKY